MTPRPALPNFHDAILETVEIDWQAATATLRLQLVGDPGPTVALVVRGLREIHIPRDEPWGPSVSVNVAEYAETRRPGDLALRLEMQSGDETRLQAESLEIT